jgi:hypothetical protein
VSTELAQPQCSLLASEIPAERWFKKRVGRAGGWKLMKKHWWPVGTLKIIGGPHVGHWWPQDFSVARMGRGKGGWKHYEKTLVA